jgi:hypothetical protein
MWPVVERSLRHHRKSNSKFRTPVGVPASWSCHQQRDSTGRWYPSGVRILGQLYRWFRNKRSTTGYMRRSLRSCE